MAPVTTGALYTFLHIKASRRRRSPNLGGIDVRVAIFGPNFCEVKTSL